MSELPFYLKLAIGALVVGAFAVWIVVMCILAWIKEGQTK